MFNLPSALRNVKKFYRLNISKYKHFVKRVYMKIGRKEKPIVIHRVFLKYAAIF
jgi:hypothetical protein